MEKWASVIGYEGIYEISTEGALRSLSRNIFRGGFLHKIEGALRKPSAITSKAIFYTLFDGKRSQIVSARNLVANAFLEVPPHGSRLRSKNRNLLDVRAENLEWTQEKECSRCKLWQAECFFYQSKKRPDGFYPYCKSCITELSKTPQARASQKKSHKKYYLNNTEKVYARSARNRKNEDPDKRYLRRKRERERDPEKYRLKNREWTKNNPEKNAIRCARRRARLKNTSGVVSVQDVDRIFNLQKGKCAICSVKLTKSFHRDHIIPLSKGGTHIPRNIQLLCKSCNSQKSDMAPIEHMKRRGKLL